VLAPLIKAGFIDYIVSTGANLYHDLHYALDLPLYQSSPFINDLDLRKHDIIRIYDIVADFEALLDTDRYVYKLLESDRLKGRMSTAKMHYEMGALVAETEKKLKRPNALTPACCRRHTRRTFPSTLPRRGTAPSA
jgi:deoxyhypusine synthase